jgi:hypothetical protein
VKNNVNPDDGGLLEHDRNEVSIMFKKFSENHKYSYHCSNICGTWQEEAGTPGGFIRNDEAFIAELHACAKMITLPDDVTLLFRGVGRERFSVEDLTATSMSCSVGVDYKPPLMIIYVPNGIVRGLVINDEDSQHNRESEILLTHPEKYMRQCSVEAATTLLKHLRKTEMILSFPRENVEYVQVWVYDIPSTDPLLTTSNSPH